MKNLKRKSAPRAKAKKDDRKTHKATCSECGEHCTVPFKPSRDKDVYCNNCFRRDDSPKASSKGGRNMHQAKCSDCGKKWEVPFKPNKDKVLYCNDCFDQDRAGGRAGNESVDAKLDRIIALLEKLVQS